MVGAFWTYYNHGDRSQTTAGQEYYRVSSPYYCGHEIDFEMLPKQGTDKFWLVNFNEFNNSSGSAYSNGAFYNANPSATTSVPAG